jgi:D-3-phosphoglycerate dehydrogenase
MTTPFVVLATDPIHKAGADIIAEAGHRLVVAPGNAMDAAKRLIPQVDALIARSKLSDDILETAGKLRGVVRHGVGLDFIPMVRAAELAIPVANVPGANSQSVAEYVFAAIFDLTRKVRQADIILRSEGWPKARANSDSAIELFGKVLGVVGLGQIGRRVAEIGASGFGMKVVGTQRRPEVTPSFIRAVSISDLFAVSDIVVLCCPLTPQTEGMVGAELIGVMKKSAYLINPARGQLIVEEALTTAMRQGGIAGAAMDVFNQQPLPQAHPYRSLPNVLLTPHLASLTADSMEKIGRISCEEAVRMLRGERPMNLANPDVWPRAQARWKELDAAR